MTGIGKDARGRLLTALTDCYPDYDAFRMFLSLQLDRRLSKLAPWVGGIDDVVFAPLETAEAEGWIGRPRPRGGQGLATHAGAARLYDAQLGERAPRAEDGTPRPDSAAHCGRLGPFGRAIVRAGYGRRSVLLLDAMRGSLDGLVFADPLMAEPVELADVVADSGAGTSVVVLSDAGEARGGVDPLRNLASLEFARGLREDGRSLVWLNPMPARHRAVDGLRGRPVSTCTRCCDWSLWPPPSRGWKRRGSRCSPRCTPHSRTPEAQE